MTERSIGDGAMMSECPVSLDNSAWAEYWKSPLPIHCTRRPNDVIAQGPQIHGRPQGIWRRRDTFSRIDAGENDATVAAADRHRSKAAPAPTAAASGALITSSFFAQRGAAVAKVA